MSDQKNFLRRNTQVSADFSLARQNAGGLRLDFSAQRAALAEINQAIGQGPRYREVDVSTGSRTIGQVGDRSSQMLFQLNQRNQEIIDKRKLLAGETALQVAMEEFETVKQQNRDPETWPRLFDEFIGARLEALDFEGMSKPAAALLQSHAERAQALGRVRVNSARVKGNEALLLGDLKAQRVIAQQAGNLEEVGRISRHMAELEGRTQNQLEADLIIQANETGRILSAQIQSDVAEFIAAGFFPQAMEYLENHPWLNAPGNEAQLEAARRRVAIAMVGEEVTNAININPWGTLDALTDPETLKEKFPQVTEEMVLPLRLKAYQTGMQQSKLVMEQVQQMINGDDTGANTTAVIDALEDPNHKFFSGVPPHVKNELLANLKDQAMKNNGGTYGSLMAEIHKISPGAAVTESELVALELRIDAAFSPDNAMKRSLQRAIGEVRKAQNEPDSKDPVSGALSKIFLEGGFGPYMFPRPGRVDDFPMPPHEREAWKNAGPTVKFTNLDARRAAGEKLYSLLRKNEEMIRNGVPLEDRISKLDNEMAALATQTNVKSPMSVREMIYSSGMFYPGFSGPNPLLPPVDAATGSGETDKEKAQRAIRERGFNVK